MSEQQWEPFGTACVNCDSTNTERYVYVDRGLDGIVLESGHTEAIRCLDCGEVENR